MKSIKSIGLVVSIVVLTLKSYSQIITEDDITTDTINLMAPEKMSSQSTGFGTRTLVNLAIPGLGHYLNGKKQMAFTYFCIDAACLFGVLWAWNHSNHFLDDSRNFAYMYSGTKTHRGQNDKYWKEIGMMEFYSSDSYNEIKRLDRQFDQMYLDKADQWKWESEESQKEYGSIRQSASRYMIASSFLLGGMILNRIVSFVEFRVSNQFKTLSQPRIQATYEISRGISGVNLLCFF